jgi:hypothetical protein
VPRHWKPPNKQESYRDMINKQLLFTCAIDLLAVKPKLTIILMNMDLACDTTSVIVATTM